MQAFTVEQVRAARAFLGWSQRELGEASGLSYETIRNFENSRNLATETLVQCEMPSKNPASNSTSGAGGSA
jgi:transcriptional regulator with XRE-family HTH domain